VTAKESKAVRLFLEGTRTIDDICAALDLTRRTVERAIREAMKAWKLAAQPPVRGKPRGERA